MPLSDLEMMGLESLLKKCLKKKTEEYYRAKDRVGMHEKEKELTKNKVDALTRCNYVEGELHSLRAIVRELNKHLGCRIEVQETLP